MRCVNATAASTAAAAAAMSQLTRSPLWIEDGTADRLVAEKRAETARRQALAQRVLARHPYRSDPAAAHVWLSLPDPWQAEQFAAAAHRRGVGVTPAAAFAAGRQIPNAVRVCIGTPPTPAALERGLTRLVELLTAAPEPYLSVV